MSEREEGRAAGSVAQGTDLLALVSLGRGAAGKARGARRVVGGVEAGVRRIVGFVV